MCRTSEIIRDADLKALVEDLDEKINSNERWDNVVDKRNDSVYYNAKCCKPKVASVMLDPCLMNMRLLKVYV